MLIVDMNTYWCEVVSPRTGGTARALGRPRRARWLSEGDAGKPQGVALAWTTEAESQMEK